jgi:aspartate racemase
MKLVGLLGAVGWKTTAHYYRMINEYTCRELGGAHTARILLHSVDSHGINLHQRSDDWPRIAEILTEADRSLKGGGANFIGLTSNAMHQVASLVSGDANLDLLHIAQPTGADPQRMDEIIFGELFYGMIHHESRRFISDVIGRLRQRGAEGVILACSEIAMFVPPDCNLIPVCDTTRLHARAAVEPALEENRHHG